MNNDFHTRSPFTGYGRAVGRRKVRPMAKRARLVGAASTVPTLHNSNQAINDWTWTATKQRPWVVRSKNRKRNRVARSSRKVNSGR